MSDPVELLFFDTFAHDNTEELNLDLVQFPKPVYVTEVRIIPLGARVQADFPGGVRLGATNPSQFQIEFFVNDLGKPGASTFESLGGFEYNQNGCINLNCVPEDTVRKIPTDGLVLRGWYTTITLAVYGTLTNNITEQIIQPVVNPTLPAQPNTIADAQQIISGNTIENEWNQENITSVPIEYNQNAASYQQTYNQSENYSQEYNEYYNDVPKDPRNYHHPPEGEWDSKVRPRNSDNERERDRERDRERERSREVGYQKTGSTERDHNRTESDRRERDRDKNYPRSRSRDRDRQTRDYSRDVSRERDWDHERQDYRNERDWERDRNRERDRDRDRDRSYKHDENYRRSYSRDERDERKRPRTPPMQSPKRPHTPHGERKEPSPPEPDSFSEEEVVEKQRREKEQREEPPAPQKSPVKEVRETVTPPAEEAPAPMDVEEFEPILSDEEIVDEEMDYDYGAYTNNDDLIKLFVPGVTNLRRFKKAQPFVVTNDRITIEENLKTTVGIVDDYFKSSITKYVLENFTKHNTEIKEEFIHLCEKLISTFGSVDHFCQIIRLHVSMKELKDHKFNAEDRELVEQINSIVLTVLDWLKIALNYEMANIQDQPAYKIRHIKCGVRLAEWCCNSSEFVKILWNSGFNIHEVLLNLYDQEYMALSIKLLIIKALDTYLLHKFAMEKFLLGSKNSCRENGFHDSLCVSKNNGYKVLVEKLRKNPSVRLKFALNSILKKINLYEVFHKLHSVLMEIRNSSAEISPEGTNLIVKSLEHILSASRNGQFVFSQPKRFLPVSAQFEIIRTETKNVLVEYYKMFDLLQCVFLLLSCPSTLNLPSVKTSIFEILSNLLKTPEGLEYLADNHETLQALLRCFLRTDEEMQYTIQDYIEIKSHNLGLEAAYKTEVLYCVENLISLGEKFNNDYDALEVVDQLHGLFCLTFTHIGRICVAEVLGMKDNIKCLLQFFGDVHLKEKSESQLNKIKKSPAIAYIIDLIVVTIIAVPNVQFLESYFKQIYQLIDQQDIFEDSVTQKLVDIRSYLSPLENVTLNYDNISQFVEVINKQIENVASFPGQLITALRVIHFLGISPHSDSSVSSDNPLSNYVELKYKRVILQLFSLDGTSILTKLLQKICDHYDQPSLHTSVFASSQGFLILSIITPCIELLKQMLTYVIQCRNTNFKDLTAVPILLQTYNLLNSYPNTSAAYHQAQETCKIIIETLLVYTQPVSDEIHEKDSLNKTLWTLMCGEVIKYVTSAPYTFVPGLLVLSELLPLPLPIQTTKDLSKDEVTWAVNLRKLWSAHLHPHSGSIQELINKLCTTSNSQLVNLLRRVCVQLADLAANSAIMIARGILDSVYKALVPSDDSKIGVCNNHVTRLLNFLACLVTHGTLKCAVLYLIHSSNAKTDEKYPSLVQIFAQVLRVNSSSTTHIQAQECILSIIQSFCDIEITLLQNSEKGEMTSDLYLANALPVKELLLNFISMILDYLQVDSSFVTYLPVVRTLLLLTEHDYGFYHLREQLNKRSDVFGVILNKLAKSFSKDNAECLSTLNTLVELIRVCSTTEEVEAALLYTPRKMKMSSGEIKGLLGWKKEEGENEEKHPLVSLEEILKKLKDEDITFESLLEGVSGVIKSLQNDFSESKEILTEPILGEPETLLIQFSGRLVFNSSDVCDERLSIRYWLSTSNDESEYENVPCDLAEIARQYLPQDFNIAREIEKLCRICPSENNNEKENHDNDQKAKTKKPFITPVRARGFPRTIQQRSDLFRSRPPNTSRPPSLHVDDFVALETCGAQPTGPTGYNKFSRELLASTRLARGSRGRAFVASERSVQCRQMSWWGVNLVRGSY